MDNLGFDSRGKQDLSWLTLSRCVFLGKVLIARPNTIDRSSTIVFDYTSVCSLGD